MTSEDPVARQAREIRQARADSHLTQRELAELLGVSERTLQYWEAGRGEPHAKHRRRLQAWFDSLTGPDEVEAVA